MAGKPKKGGLGRGLDALIADTVPVVKEEKERPGTGEPDENSIIYVSINDIRANKDQPRKNFDEEKIRELADSITEHGIIQPLVVRKKGNFYEIVAGERRWRAARTAELTEVPCIVREFTDEENMLVAIIENMQREDLDPIEEALGINQMIKTYGFTQEQVSKSISKSRPYISNTLRLLKLPEEIRQMVSEGKISAGHARAIINVSNPEQQEEIAERAHKEGLSVRDVEKLVLKINKPKKQPRKKVKSPNAARVEDELRELFGTKVTINSTGKKGRIEIEYYGQEDLNRIVEQLKTADK